MTFSREQVKIIATKLGVPEEQDVIDMNRRLGGDASLNAPVREAGATASGRTGWSTTADSREAASPKPRSSTRRKAHADAAPMAVLNERERRIFEARRLDDDPITLEELCRASSACRASASARSKSAPSRRCRTRW